MLGSLVNIVLHLTDSRRGFFVADVQVAWSKTVGQPLLLKKVPGLCGAPNQQECWISWKVSMRFL